MAAMRLTSPPPFGGREVIAALEGKVRAGQLDVGTALWQAASLGSAETLELVLQVPDAKDKIDYVPEKGQFSPLMAAAKRGSLDCVKLLLYHGANLYYSYSNILVANVKVWHVARKERHPVVEQYLRNCESDYQKCGANRAFLELTVWHIASKFDYTPSDIVEFFDCLRNLINYCKFNVDSTCDEENKKYRPLLLRAAYSDNSAIVTRLLREFQARPDIRDPTTGENLLHVCFKISSKLRFYFLLEYPELINQIDKTGYLPLFYACEQNDVAFFCWLFQRSNSAPGTPALTIASEPASPRDASVDDHIQRPGRMSGDYRDYTLARVNSSTELDAPPSPHIAEVVNMRPFTAAKDGNSILHILAEEGAREILSIITRMCSHVEGFDFSALSVRRNKLFPLPIEKALSSNNTNCLKVLLDLAISSYQLPMLLDDKHVLKASIITKNIENVKTLVKFGFHTGIELAITLAAAYNLHDIVRLLLIWDVEIQNYTDFPHIARHRSLKASKLIWKQLELQFVDPRWLEDARNITNMVTRTLVRLKENGNFKENNVMVYQELGEMCVNYFEGNGPVPQSVSISGLDCKSIVTINLSENHLEEVPIEMFQLPSLACLDLKYNKIKSLPSSGDFSSALYSSKLESLCLDYNELTSIPEELVWGLANTLESLSIQSNKLTKIPPGLWLMPKLTIFKLANNCLSSLHYLSKEHFFTSIQLLDKIISLEVTSDGSLQFQSRVTEAEKDFIKKHMKDLAWLYRTVIAIKFPDSKYTKEFLYSELIQVYRAKHHFQEAVNAGEIPTPLSEADVTTFALAFTLSEVVFTSNLKFLDISYNNFRAFPWDLKCLAPNLKKLDLDYNSVSGLDIAVDLPKEIDSVSMQMNKIASVRQPGSSKLPCGSPVELVSVSRPGASLASLSTCRHSQHEILEKLTRLNLNNNLLTSFPILKNQVDTEAPINLAVNYPLYPELAILSLASNKLTEVPHHLHCIKHLSSLILSHNPITELPEELGLINTDYITLIKLEGIKPRNISDDLLKSPARKLITNLRNLRQRARPYRCVKLMLVGEANRGKTSLLLNLTKISKGRMTHFSTVEMGVNDIPLSTVGVDLGEFKYSPHISKPVITFMTWDFGGQEEYYATHQCFLTKRSIYLLLWDIRDGEEGLKTLKPWLENIESCAPMSPVIVVGTHWDQVCPNSSRDRERRVTELEGLFREMYGRRSNTSRTYPAVASKCYLMDVRNARQVDQLRDHIYDLATNFRQTSCLSTRDTLDTAPLLEKLVPESYTVLHDLVRNLAEKCRLVGAHPILTKAQLMKELSEVGFSFESDFDQVGSFLHENGILLHYDDISPLNDLYFVDPQWLCKMVSRIITIRIKNPYYNKGFMWMKDVVKIFSTYAEEFINLLSKFEIVFKLDGRRLVIPSLLPDSEDDACLVYSSTLSNSLDTSSLLVRDVDGYDNFGQLDMQLFCRYFLLPFIPNGFFTRLIARLMGSDIIDQLQRSLKGDPLEAVHVSNTIHWRCWRNGIVLVWNQKEIFRVAPLTNARSSRSKAILITQQKVHKVLSSPTGLEIKVAVIPEVKIRKLSFLEPAVERLSEANEGIFSNLQNPSMGKSIVAWLLHKTTMMVDSIFNDWYEGFGSRSFEDESTTSLRMADYCSSCLSLAHQSAYSNVVGSLYLFSSTYCCLAGCKGMKLDCPGHGPMRVEDIAPDLVFGDFHPATVFSNSSKFTIKTLYPLGSGGYGTVYKAIYQRRPSSQYDPVYIAQKKINSTDITFTEDQEILAQLKAWSRYQRASTEARVMNELSHKNILALIGVCFQPNDQLSILIELAPKGDLKTVVQDYKSEGVRLSRRTIKVTLIQVAEAMEYLHSINIIYRDLKPHNILVWKFPNPKSSSTSSVIHVKIADYGISSVINPHQGNIRGLDGTEPYQSPEIINFGGKKAYSFHVDVYAFGMCMYYLVAQQHPFVDSHVSVALKEGRRPSIPHKLQPHSISIIDLMCWCWSDLPQDRPDFTQILEALKSEAFTNLLASADVFNSKSGQQITASCVNSIITPKLKISEPREPQLTSLARLMSLVHGRATRRGEPAMQVIYGTDCGQCEVIQFQSSGAVRKVIEIPLNYRKYVSCIRVVNDRIWISTVGAGLFVYNAITLQFEASWGDKDKENIYTLLDIKDMSCMIALTSKGLFSFSTEVGGSTFFDYLDYQVNCSSDFEGITMNVGVVIPASKNVKACEVWVCSHSERRFYILNARSLNIIKVVDYSEKDLAILKRKELSTSLSTTNSRRRGGLSGVVRIRELKELDVDSRVKLAVADSWNVALWDVERRRLEDVFDCMEYCKSHHTELPASPNSSAHITSLDAQGDILYTGLENGLVLCLKCGPDSISVLLRFSAYDRAVSSVMVMKPPKRKPESSNAHARPYFTERQDKPHSAAPAKLPLLKPDSNPVAFSRRNKRQRSMDIVPGSFQVNSIYQTAENLLLISLGKAYTGIVGCNENHPKEFILPSVGTQSNRKPAKAEETCSHLLIWSTEICDQVEVEESDMSEDDYPSEYRREGMAGEHWRAMRSSSPLTRSTGVRSHEMQTSSGGTRQVSPHGQMSASTSSSTISSSGFSVSSSSTTSAQSYENVAGPRAVRSPLLSSRHSPETYEVPQVRESVRVTGQAAHDHRHPHSQTLSAEATSSTSVRRAYENTTLKPVHSAREVSVRSKSPHKYSAFPWPHDTEELQVENTTHETASSHLSTSPSPHIDKVARSTAVHGEDSSDLSPSPSPSASPQPYQNMQGSTSSHQAPSGPPPTRAKSWPHAEVEQSLDPLDERATIAGDVGDEVIQETVEAFEEELDRDGQAYIEQNGPRHSYENIFKRSEYENV